MDEVTFYMKHLIPGGEGAFYVLKITKNTQEGADKTRDVLMAFGMGDATLAEYDNACSGYPAVGSILNGEEWKKVDVEGEEDDGTVKSPEENDEKVPADEEADGEEKTAAAE